MNSSERALYLIRLGEICLKGENRSFFEKRLKNNIRKKLKGYAPRFRMQKGRIFLEVDGTLDQQVVTKALATSFGIVGFAPAWRGQKDIEVLRAAAIELFGSLNTTGEVSFKVNSRRSDKSFPLSSYEISCQIGDAILTNFKTRVDVHTPEISIFVEIRDKAYIYTSSSLTPGPGGLPVGIAGKGLLLLSGGIDSPVAGYRMASRGLRMDAIYFHAYPYTSNEALDKVTLLAKTINPYLCGLRLFVVPFTEAQLHINSHAPQEEHTLLMRYCMVKIANMVAKTVRAQVLITGESLSQVASQTIESLSYTESASTLPIFRPLIGSDKEEIIGISKRIGTYETSILPYEDCCTIFSPAHPLVRPDLERMTASYESLQIEELLQETAARCEIIDCRD